MEQMELKDDALQARLQTEARMLKEAERDVQNLKQDQYRKGQTLFEEKQKETDLLSNISGIAAQDKNMRSKITTVDEQVQEPLFRSAAQLRLMLSRLSSRKRFCTILTLKL